MGVILLTMTIGGLIIAAILLAIAYSTKTNWLKTFVLGGVVTWFASYAILFFISSFFSVERTLDLNEPKEFCGFYFDCHLHAAVSDIRKSKTIGGKLANGEFYIVKVKISSDAKQATLGLLTVDAHAVDALGQIYKRDEQAEILLGEQPPFDKQTSPNETFTKEIVFDLPNEIKNPRLDIREGYGIDHAIEAILIGDEDSFGHRRNFFKLEQQTETVGVK